MTRQPLPSSPRSVHVRGDASVYPFEGFSVDLVFTGVPSAGNTFTVGSQVYTWRVAPGAEAYAVDIGTTAAISRDNAVKAIMASGTATVEYGTGTLVHPDAMASNGYPTDSMHLVSATDLVVAETTGNALLKNKGGITVAAMTQYPTGDYTLEPTASALISSTGCAVVGMVVSEGSGNASQGMEFSTHAGVQAQYIKADEAAGSDNQLLPLCVWTDAGLRVTVDTDFTAYVHYQGYPTPSRFPG